MKKGKDYIGIGCGTIIFNNKGQVLLTQRGENSRNEKGKWHFPGGSIEFGEALQEGLKREIKEELDIAIEILHHFDIVDHILPNEKQHWISILFISKLVDGDVKILEPEKCSAFKWIKFSDIDPSTLMSVNQSNYKKFISMYGINKIF